MTTKKAIENSAYEKSWQNAIKRGRVQFGNLQINLDFLQQTGLIRDGLACLELGCGIGNIAAFLQEQGVSMIASDISQTAIDHAQKAHPEIDFRQHSAESLPYEDQCFDLVMSFDVLEHLSDVEQHLCEVRRVLKPGGSYLLQTPNKLSNSVFETLKCRSMAWKKYHPSLHFYGQLRRRFRRNGFSFQCIKMNTMNEFAIQKIKRVGLPGGLFSWIDFRHLPYWLQTNFYVSAQRQMEL